MDAKLRAHLERLLLAERDRTADALHRAEVDVAVHAVSAGARARTGWDPADVASDVLEEESDSLTATRASAHLAEVDEALQVLAVDADALAFCMRCGWGIERARLELVPWTRRCALCARANGRAHPELN